MPDILTVHYSQTGASTKPNTMGMREMQARSYEKRNAQYLLIKAPPASGKSRALMYIALDKVLKQGLKKVIIAVPETSIGKSFDDTDLTSYGFFADWKIDPRYNLCTPGDEGKVRRVLDFLEDPTAHYLICTHATFRFAFRDARDPRKFNRTLIAFDEFHHVSIEEGNILGGIIDRLMSESTAHIVAMTGSYFRGDAVPILRPEDEAKFTVVTYTYYEQLNGYKYLKSLGIGYHFYQGRYFDAIKEVLDTTKKTIVHIPNVNSMESTGDKRDEVDRIMDVIGEVLGRRDPDTGIYRVKTHDGRILFVADLVDDSPERVKVLNYLRNIKNASQMDIIIALGMAKEGFDWPWCEHVLTVGYRSSLTEVVQIIGRATRDCEGKTHAQFTNLIAQPDAEDVDVRNSVNNMLKAITVSLLMEQILAPSITFKPRSLMAEGEVLPPGTLPFIDTNRPHPVSARVAKLLKNGAQNEIIAEIMQDKKTVGPLIAGVGDPKLFREEAIPKIVKRRYPDLTPEETKDMSEAAYIVMVRNGLTEGRAPEAIGEGGEDSNQQSQKAEVGSSDPQSQKAETEDSERDPTKRGSEFLKVGEKFINIERLNIDLIATVNPFQGAYEILSKSVNAAMLKTIQDVVVSDRAGVSEEEATLLWPDVQTFVKEHGRKPSPTASDAFERRLGEVLAFIMRRLAERKAQQQ